MPHIHMSGIAGLATFLFIVAAFGSLKLLAMSFPNSTLSQSWLALF